MQAAIVKYGFSKKLNEKRGRMKRILSVVIVVAMLLLALSVVSCVPPSVSQEEYNKVVAERDEALKRIETLESKIEEASKYAEFLAWFMAGPKPTEPEAMEKYYAPMLEKVIALEDPKALSMAMEIAKMEEEMEAKGATLEEIYLAKSIGPGGDWLAYLAERIPKLLCWPCF